MSGAAIATLQRLVALPPKGGPPRSGGQPDRRQPARRTPNPRRVLIVEDEALVALTLEAILQDIGHQVIGIATNARGALALAALANLVLMDVRLGAAGDEGIVAGAMVTAQTAARIVFVTAYNDPATLARIRTAVPSAKVLAKPVGAAELAQAIDETMRGS
jgi:two-component system, response regulator PdtaR